MEGEARATITDGPGNIRVAASLEGERCTETAAEAGSEWSIVTIDLASTCGGLSNINAVTIDNPSDNKVLLLDDVAFE